MKSIKSVFVLLVISLSLICINSHCQTSSKRVKILGIGDSITEGGGNFSSYLFPLWENLFTNGYNFEFIGPRKSKCRIGAVNCAGYSGRNAEYLNSIIDTIYQKYTADIVLLHSGHNHFIEEKPINGIIEAQKSIINKILTINPEAKIIVAQVVESGKLPKYSYIPKLNKEIKKMVKGLHNPNVSLVNQAKDFNWQIHTIQDKVHPNQDGAKTMADTWFKAMQKVLPKDNTPFKPELISYKSAQPNDLKLHVFKPEKLKKGEKCPAMVYFFGGGWVNGTPIQFYRECTYYASKGMVAIAADYRIATVNKTSPFESVEDAHDAIKWIREHAEELNIDPNKIVASGSSAGGHLAATTGTLTDKDSPSRPNLMVLFYPVVDNGPEGYGYSRVKDRYLEFSPMHNIDSNTPPCLFLLGTKDKLIPVSTGKLFQKKMLKAGVHCELELFEGAGHPIFYYAKELDNNFYKVRSLVDNFLKKYGYIE